MATYYVSNAGSDGNNGQSTASPWQTLAKVAGFTFQAGDSILLRRGDRWRETLTVPRANLTFGAYGADPITDTDGYVTNAPIIDGGEYVTGWSSYTGGAEVRAVVDNFTGTAGQLITARDPNPGDPWTKHDLFTANTPVVSNANRLRRGGTPDAGGQYVVMANPELATPQMDDYYVQCDVFVASTATDFVSVLARFFSYKDSGYAFALGGASGSLTLRKYSQGVLTTLGTGTALTMAANQTWTIRIEVQGSTIRGMVKTQGAGTWAQTVTATDTEHAIASHGGLRLGSASSVAPSDTVGLHVDNFEIGPLGTTGAPVNTYQATLSTNQPVIDYNGTLMLLGRNPDQLNAGEYYWQSNVLYLRSETGLPSNTSVVASNRENGIFCDSKTAVTLDGLAFEHVAGRSAWFNNSAAPTVRNCMAQRSSGSGASGSSHGVFAFTGTSNTWTVSASVVRYSTSDGIYVQGPVGGTITGSLIGPCISSFADCVQVEGSRGVAGNVTISSCRLRMSGLSPKGAIILFGDGHIVDGCQIAGPGGAGRVSGNFGISIAGNHVIVRGNVFVRVPNDAVRITDSTTPSQTVDDHLVHHNVMIDCGVGIYLVNPGTNQRYYANTITNAGRNPQFNGTADYQLKIDQTIAGEIKNNIVWNTSGSGQVYKVGTASASLVSDYNDLGPEGTGFINYAGTAHGTLAAYVAARAKDQHSLTVTPQFINPGGLGDDGSDYTLYPLSPVFTAGTMVGGIVDQSPAPMGAVVVLGPIPFVEPITDSAAVYEVA